MLQVWHGVWTVLQTRQFSKTKSTKVRWFIKFVSLYIETQIMLLNEAYLNFISVESMINKYFLVIIVLNAMVYYIVN